MDFRPLFHPDSIALIGASGNPEKLAGRPYDYLAAHDYHGEIHLVNPAQDEIDGNLCHNRVTDINGPVDLAMILVSATSAPNVVEECGKLDIPFAIVVASGFNEYRSETNLEEDLRSIAREKDIRIVGPNSQGMINLSTGATVSFSSILKRKDLKTGGVSIISQSGSFGGSLFQMTQNIGLGTSKWISTGNETDLNTLDFADYLIEDKSTNIIGIFAENFTDGERLIEIGQRAAEKDTHIVTLVAGTSKRGQEATESHTGSIATKDEIYDSIFRQSGITRVRSIEAFEDAINTFSRQSLPRKVQDKNPTGIGVLSVSGGAAALIADSAASANLPLARFNQSTLDKLTQKLPQYASKNNPIDITAQVMSDPKLFDSCLRTIARDKSVSGLLLQLGNSGNETLEACKESLIATNSKFGGPISLILTGSKPDEDTAAQLLREGILIFEDPLRAVNTFAMSNFQASFRHRSFSSSLDQVDRCTKGLPYDDWLSLTGKLENEGINFVNSFLVGSEKEAVDAASKFSYPVVLKLNPIDTKHKSEVDGVRLGLGSPTEVRQAFREVTGNTNKESAIVQPMIMGTEVIVSVTKDTDFGPILVLGAGGIFVELFDEFAYRALPVSEDMAEDMIDETVIKELLDGYRGAPPGNRKSLIDFLVSLSIFYLKHDIREIELNPVIVRTNETLAVDVLVE